MFSSFVKRNWTFWIDNNFKKLKTVKKINRGVERWEDGRHKVFLIRSRLKKQQQKTWHECQHIINVKHVIQRVTCSPWAGLKKTTTVKRWRGGKREYLWMCVCVCVCVVWGGVMEVIHITETSSSSVVIRECVSVWDDKPVGRRPRWIMEALPRRSRGRYTSSWFRVGNAAVSHDIWAAGSAFVFPRRNFRFLQDKKVAE